MDTYVYTTCKSKCGKRHCYSIISQDQSSHLPVNLDYYYFYCTASRSSGGHATSCTKPAFTHTLQVTLLRTNSKVIDVDRGNPPVCVFTFVHFCIKNAEAVEVKASLDSAHRFFHLLRVNI